jgi:hypothetical protein
LIFDEGLNPRIGSALLASFSSISPNELMKKRNGSYFLCLGQNRGHPACGSVPVIAYPPIPITWAIPMTSSKQRRKNG